MERIASEVLKEEVKFATLPSGLRVAYIPKKGFSEKIAAFTTNYGSIDREFVIPKSGERITVPDGIAHFLEHKLFEEKDYNVFERFAALGASANAFTNYTLTSYFFTCSDNFFESLEVLIDFVLHPYFTDENVAKEKGIIQQELRMYEDNPQWKVFSNLMRGLFHIHPARIDIGGTVESIQKITKELLFQCYETFYHPSNMLLLVCGDLPEDEVFERIKARMAAKGFESQPPIQRPQVSEPDEPRERLIREKMAVSQPTVFIGYKDNRREDGEPLMRRELATNIILEALLGRGSDLYRSLYDDGLIDEKFGFEFMGQPSFGLTAIGGETPDPDDLVDRVQGELDRMTSEGINAEDVSRVRKKLHGDFLRAFNSPAEQAHNFSAYYFRGMSLFDFPRVLDSIENDFLETRLREHFVPDNRVVSIVEP